MFFFSTKNRQFLVTIYPCTETSHFKMSHKYTIAMPLSSYKLIFAGLAPPGYKLVSVHIVSRHGTRALMNTSLSLGPLKYPKMKCKLNIMKSSMPHLLKEFIGEF